MSNRERMALTHNTQRSGPDRTVPVVIEDPSHFPFAPGERERDWHETTEDEYVAYLAYWHSIR